MNVQDITAQDWSLSLAQQGEIVTELSDINQCIYIILTTDRGSDPLRPLFGSNIFRYVDKPVNVAIPNIIREIVDGIRLWETRVSVTKISHKQVDVSHITFTVEWETVSKQAGTTTITI